MEEDRGDRVPQQSHGPVGPLWIRAVAPGTAGSIRHGTRVIPLLVRLGAVKLALHAITAASYGYHRDELYYIVGGRHLELGYVDHPPLTPWLAAAADALSGGRLAVFRLVPALAGAMIVVLAGLIAGELGGGRLAQLFAGLAVLATPLYLAANALFQTVSFDQLTWVLAALLLVRLLRRDRLRLWLAIGFVVGVGLLAKYTILLFVLGLGVGLLATGARRQLVTPWPWLGAAVALLLLTPNLVWQAAHGWPTLEFVANTSAAERAEASPEGLALQHVLLIGPVLLPIAVIGLGRLLAERTCRPLGVAAVVVLVLVVALRAKPYYAGPLYPTLLAAGAVSCEPWLLRGGRRRTRGAVTVLLVALVLEAPFTVQLLPRAVLVDSGLYRVREDFAEMFGWPELATTVGRVYRGLPPVERR